MGVIVTGGFVNDLFSAKLDGRSKFKLKMEKLLSSSQLISKTGLNFYRYICAPCLNRHASQCLLRNENITKKSFKVCGKGHKNVTGCSGHFTFGNDRRTTVIFNRKQRKHFNREHRAFSELLERSGYPGITRLYHNQCRCFSTSKLSCSRDDNNRNQDNKNKNREDEEQDEPPIKPGFLPFFYGFLILFALYILSNYQNRVLQISWQTFEHEILAKGEVKDISIREQPHGAMAVVNVYPGAVIKNVKAQAPFYILTIENIEKFEEKVRKAERAMGVSVEDQVTISYDKNEAGIVDKVFGLLFLVMIVSLMVKSLSVAVKRTGMDMFSQITKAKFTRVDKMSTGPGGKTLSFKDVAGLKEAKVEVMEFVDYLKHPHRYKALGGKIPKGALLLGPPGCGKTLLAKAVAAEASVPFLSMAGSEFVEMLGGLGASRVRDLFKEARKNAPCIIYIDEIDALGRSRSGGDNFGSGEEEHTLNQLLVEMDGMGTVEGVIMLASTNRAHVLDKALLRPGRFDRHISIDLPTVIERLETFEMYLQKLRLEGTISQYAPKLAQMTPGMSGADIANLCNEAALHAARYKKDAVGTEDFNYAVERVIAGQAKKTGQLSPNEKKMVAYHESGHALISIVPRTGNALGFAQYVPNDHKLVSSEELFEKMCMALGGRAAEAIIFNHITTGAQNDLENVTRLANRQIKAFGMNERIGPLSFPEEEDGFGVKPYSQALASLMDELAEALLDKEVLSYEEVTELIGAPPHGDKHIIDPHWFTVDFDMKSTKKRTRRESKTKAE
ncbi:hypothetical protein KUTeg_019927 [Tegillarca granosa]|uniref:AAA+ ATPase domain-containing protein n=1 Tax=Tegillarca granosa TaxID=220873 RepID=A0ABQ9EDV5_TEGGR|nr:hypothetical protein KUTeg_019927 [Tegillarca granosa]